MQPYPEARNQQDDMTRRRLSSMEGGRTPTTPHLNTPNTLGNPLLDSSEYSDGAPAPRKKVMSRSGCHPVVTTSCVLMALVVGCVVGAAAYGGYSFLYPASPSLHSGGGDSDDGILAPELIPRLVEVGINSITLDFDRYPRALQYTAECTELESKKTFTMDSSTSKVTVTGLEASTLYECVYRVTVPEGVSPDSPSVRYPTLAATVPGKSAGVWAVEPTTADLITLDWDETENGGSDITEYELLYSESKADNTVKDCYKTGPGCSVCDAPYEEESSETFFTLGGHCKDVPFTGCPNFNLKLVCYDFQCCRDVPQANEGQVFESLYKGKDSHFTHKGLPAGHKYAYKVLARNEVGDGLPSLATPAFTSTPDAKVPDRADAPRIKDSTPISLRLAWDIPEHNGAMIVKAKLLMHDGDKTSVACQDERHLTKSCTVENLKPATKYTFSVQVKNEKGWSPEGTKAELETPEAGAPPTCSPVEYANSGPDWIDVKLKAAPHYDKTIEQKYELEYKQNRATEYTKVNGAIDIEDEGELVYRVGSLVHNKHYNFRVRAVNSKGSGSWSEVIEDCCDTQLSGKCNAKDRKIMTHSEKAEYEYSDIAHDCGKSNLGRSEATAACIRSQVSGFSAGCASCFGEVASCGKSKCWSKCFPNDMSQGCRQCYQDNCRPSLAECAGIAMEDLPRERPL